MFPTQITQICGNLSKVVGETFQPLSSFLKSRDGTFECDFPVKYGGQI